MLMVTLELLAAFDGQSGCESIWILHGKERLVSRIPGQTSTEVGKTSLKKFSRQPFFIPHPKVVGTAEMFTDEGDESLWTLFATEKGVTQKIGKRFWIGIGLVGRHQLLKIRHDESEEAARFQVTLSVTQGGAKILKGQMFQDMGAVDRLAGVGREIEAAHNVTINHRIGKTRLQPLLEDPPNQRQALQSQRWARIAVMPVDPSSQPAAVVQIHKFGCNVVKQSW